MLGSRFRTYSSACCLCKCTRRGLIKDERRQSGQRCSTYAVADRRTCRTCVPGDACKHGHVSAGHHAGSPAGRSRRSVARTGNGLRVTMSLCLAPAATSDSISIRTSNCTAGFFSSLSVSIHNVPIGAAGRACVYDVGGTDWRLVRSFLRRNHSRPATVTALFATSSFRLHIIVYTLLYLLVESLLPHAVNRGMFCFWRCRSVFFVCG